MFLKNYTSHVPVTQTIHRTEQVLIRCGDYFLQVVRRTARKAHRCCECDGLIATGERYHYSRGIGEDGPEGFKQCADCFQLFNEITAQLPQLRSDDPICFGGLAEEITNGHWPEFQIRFEAIKKKRRPNPTPPCNFLNPS